MIKKIIGAVLLLLVFGGLISITVYACGWKNALFAWAIGITTAAMIGAGFYLLIN